MRCGGITTSVMEVSRIHGGYCFIKESPMERYWWDAPLMILGEGANETMRQVIAK